MSKFATLVDTFRSALTTDRPTVGQCVQRYLQDVTAKRESLKTRRNEYQLAPLICSGLGKVPIADLTTPQVHAFVQAMGATTPVYATRARSMLSQVVRHAELWGYRKAGESPVRAVPGFSARERECELSDDEYDQFDAAWGDAFIAGDISLRAAIAIRLMRDTGCRPGEAMSARWENFDPQAGTLRVTGKRGLRPLKLADDTVEFLRSVQTQAEGWLCPSDSKSGHIEDVRKPLALLLRRAGIKRITPHGFRHAFGTKAAAVEIPENKIALLMGHKDVRSTRRYTHLQMRHVAAAAQRVARKAGV